MKKSNHISSLLWKLLTLLILIVFGAPGCASIHSEAVRSLIDIETEKIGQTAGNAEEFTKSTDQAIGEWKKSVKSLSDALQNQRKVESVHSLVFSANRNIESKTGIDAHAAAYLIGQIYLADRMGLEQAVLDQFDEDFETLKKLAKQIKESWKALEKTNKEVKTFSERSFLATVDANLVRSLVVEFGVDTEGVDLVLDRSKQVNDALKKASGLGLIERADSGRTQIVIEDVVNILKQIKTQNSQPGGK